MKNGSRERGYYLYRQTPAPKEAGKRPRGLTKGPKADDLAADGGQQAKTVADFLAGFIAVDNYKLKTRRVVHVTNLVYLQRGQKGKNYLEITRNEMITYFQNKHSIRLTIGQEQGRFERWIGAPLHSRLFQFTNSYFIFKLPR
jgi:hypothetical protein